MVAGALNALRPCESGKQIGEEGMSQKTNLNQFPCAICTKPMEPGPNDDVYLMTAGDRPTGRMLPNGPEMQAQYRVLCDRCGENLREATGTMLKINFGILKQQTPGGGRLIV